MKLYKALSRRVVNKNFYDYRLRLPSKVIEELKWDENAELDWVIRNGKFVLEKI